MGDAQREAIHEAGRRLAEACDQAAAAMRRFSDAYMTWSDEEREELREYEAARVVSREGH